MIKETTVREEKQSLHPTPKVDRSFTSASGGSASSRVGHWVAAFALVALITTSMVLVLATVPTNTAAESHDPIYIWGDPAFADGIAESGVRSGSGTQGDPYIISDWEIVITTGVVTEHGVCIRDTDAHFIIRNVTVSQTEFHGTLNFNGIYLWNADNGTVEDCTLTGWLKKGIYTTGSSNVLIRDNDVSIEPSLSSDRMGIEVYSAPSVDVVVSGNNVTSANYGIKVGYADGITVKNNHVLGVNKGGILLQYSESGTVWGNMMTGCGIDLWIGTLAESNSHVIPQNNTVNGLPVHYVKDVTGSSYDSESVGQLIFANCADVTVSGMSFSDCDVGIQVYYCNGVSLSGITVADAIYNGMTVHYTDDFEMTDSTISRSGRVGLELWSGVDFTVANCTIESNLNNGMSITYSQQVNVTGCNISYNDNLASCGIDYRVLNTAIDLQSSITYNEFRGNAVGVALSGCRGVMVHHNSFIDNTVQAEDTETDLNQWDNGTEGNYWSDYDGLDEVEPFGIGDTPYDIDGNTFDNYPLVDVQVIPEFGSLLVPIAFILAVFAVARRRMG